jgi:hypothetical protein
MWVAPRFRGTVLRNIGSGFASVRLDVEGSNDVAPLLGFLGDQLTELGRRSRQRRAADPGSGVPPSSASRDFILGSARNLRVELVDDIERRFLWRANTVPRGHLIACDKLAYARNVG